MEWGEGWGEGNRLEISAIRHYVPPVPAMSRTAIHVCAIGLVWALFVFFCYAAWNVWRMVFSGQLLNL